VFESDKFILSKSDIFIDKRYHYDGFLKNKCNDYCYN